MTQGSVHHTDLTGDAGLRGAGELAVRLREALAAHDAVSIATGAMTGADITTIQLLLSARKQAQATHKSLTLAAPVAGVLRDLLIATGCLSADGRPLTADGDFWTQQPRQNKGTPA